MFLHSPSGLYLTKFRAYDPYSARWLSRDPAGELAGGSTDLYAYVGNDPINEIDLLGLDCNNGGGQYNNTPVSGGENSASAESESSNGEYEYGAGYQSGPQIQQVAAGQKNLFMLCYMCTVWMLTGKPPPLPPEPTPPSATQPQKINGSGLPPPPEN